MAATSAATRASWTDEKDTRLLNLLIEQARLGKRADSGFKKEAWVAVSKAFNNEFKSSWTVQQVKTRVQTLKSKHTTVTHMVRSSGFGWDYGRNVCLVHDTVWLDYVKQHPKAIDYRYRPLPYFELLEELFEGTFATGENAISSARSRLDDADAYTPANVSLVERAEPPEPEQDQPASTQSAAATGSSNKRKGGSADASDESKKTRTNGGTKIAQAIDKVAQQMANRNAKKIPLSSSQRAIKALQKSYKDALTKDDMVRAFNIMLDESKAKIFLVMDDNECRDIWLNNEIEGTSAIERDY